ncbi:NlpC/P60 family protein [Streptomyces sp. NPDC003077]|uniref:C40 family peptidase n=1 Tax=Streptomyces sp. NPDC003077 TaxID=3154443 RepID=UPI0033BD8DDA
MTAGAEKTAETEAQVIALGTAEPPAPPPTPRSYRSYRSYGLLRAAGVAVLAGTVVLTALAPDARAEPTPGYGPSYGSGSGTGASVSRLLARMQDLYQQAEAATEAYNAARGELRTHRRQTKNLASRLKRAQRQLARSREDAGRLARQQYQGAGPSEFSPALRFLLADDPQSALDQDHLLGEVADDQAATVTRLIADEKRARRLADAARAALRKQQKLADRRTARRNTAQRKLKEIEQALASLSPEQLDELQRLEQRGTVRAQRRLLASGLLGDDRSGPSWRAGQAIAYGLAQLGKPYLWGAEGPDSFDCSGLTSQAWAHAGRTIPRTSQEQWRRLPHVSLRRLRPGDLVLYFPGATHVGLYLGDGKVLHAPRPGSRVKVSPIASNPLLGAVRPDAGGAGTGPANGHGGGSGDGPEAADPPSHDSQPDSDGQSDSDSPPSPAEPWRLPDIATGGAAKYATAGAPG